MKILSIHSGGHDSSACVFDGYRLLAAVSQERMTRKKCDGNFPHEAIAEVLDIADIARSEVDAVVLTRNYYPVDYIHHGPFKRAEYAIKRAFGITRYKDLVRIMRHRGKSEAEQLWRRDLFIAQNGFRKDVEIFFCNHHKAHALSALFYTDWKDALVYTADGGGDNVHYSHHVLKDAKLETLYGDDSELLKPKRIDSIGLAYGYATQALGFKINRHEGKLTGLAAYGKPNLYEEMAKHFRVDEHGQVHSDFASNRDMRECIERIAQGQKREDVAASVQELLERVVQQSVSTLLKKHKLSRLALAGGVFANVRLNRLLCEANKLEEIFIFPAMGDDGLCVGGALEFLLQKHGMADWLKHRHRLPNAYLGRAQNNQMDELLATAPGITKLPGNPAEVTADLLAKGKAIAIYSQRMEFGPRALGARTIIASPADHGINDSLNDRLSRSEFMPFAPFVLEEDARDVFEVTDANAYACRFMTITCAVHEEWKTRIPAVVHVDGTARPQIITREDNPLYADILTAFKRRTGLAALVNTSFNAHEEPIINRPEECFKALDQGRIDGVVTEGGVWVKA
jgi:carbamoyltransferase